MTSNPAPSDRWANLAPTADAALREAVALAPRDDPEDALEAVTALDELGAA